MNKRNSDMLVFTLLLSLIILISILIIIFNPYTSSKIVRKLAVLYNKGLNANFTEYLNDSNYAYPQDVLSAYNFFKGRELSDFHGFSVSRVATNVLLDIYEGGDPSIEALVRDSHKKKNPLLKERIVKAIGLASVTNMYDVDPEQLSNAIYNALTDFSSIQLQLSVGSESLTLDLSEIEPEIVLAICFKESGLNPFALGEVIGEIPEFKYSRGLMQIYQKTLYTLNTWLADNGINISPEELWNIRNNIFLGMVYLAYAREQLMKGE
ncbi:hypothetical protein AT15_06690 [Kosmotoga arenicorallina S304]|uniref:Transglycosylase SLT domain-containing protein n=1 Tax=Kosmotoga arenicorallina S304 TaxID=1453497 RepID=A0A176K1Z0_9BACT|nr:transglycosylase SLT domain-containing protein [Kosmotoga arenicorallina]OAA31179.1 hypothetical protein AT15_06690 [Kosmotoga arenicorallina S304]